MMLLRGCFFWAILLFFALPITASSSHTNRKFLPTKHAWFHSRQSAIQQQQQQLVDCLSVSISNSNKTSPNGVLRYLLTWSPRRYLYTLSQSVTRTRKPPAPSTSAAPAEAPQPTPPLEQDDDEDVFLPIDELESPPPSPLRKNSSYWSPPPPPPPSASSDDTQARRLVFLGAVAGTCLVIASVLFCCVRGSGARAPDGTRDDKPLLALTSSIYSAASSRNNSLMFRSSSSKVFNNKSLNLGSLLSLQSGKQSEFVAPQIPGLKPPPGKEAPLPPPAPAAAPPPPPPPAPAPPPPPKVVRPPPAPPPKAMGGNKPNAPKPHRKGSKDDDDAESGSQKAKLKPFFWDKTVLTNTDQSMVWNEISSGSFQFNEEMIETLFGYNSVEKNKADHKKDSSVSETLQYIQIIDTKKAQNLGILLRALNVTTEEVVDALQEGNELPVDLLATLLKVAPTAEEELKLRLFTGELTQLGPADRFLKILVDIPYAFKRLESLLFMCSFQEESSSVQESLATLEVACNKLRSSRLFLKLLEAVLKTGNRMNDGTYRGGAQAFRLDTLLKLADVKGTDGKTTLLHFVITEIIRSEGAKALRNARASSMSSVRTDDLTEEISELGTEEHRCSLGIEVVSALSYELEDVKKAAAVDADALASTLSRQGHSLLKTRNFLDAEMSDVNEESEFFQSLTSFVKQAETDATRLLEEEKRIMALVKSTTDYFHGSTGKDEGLRLFVIVRDFLIMVDKVCREVKKNSASKPAMKNSSSNSNLKKDGPNAPAGFSENLQSLSDVRQRLFPAIAGRRVEDSSSSSDEES